MSGAEPDRCVAPPTPDRTRRLGPARRMPESALLIARGRRLDAAGLRLRAGKGLEFNVAAEAAARAPDPRDSRRESLLADGVRLALGR